MQRVRAAIEIDGGLLLRIKSPNLKLQANQNQHDSAPECQCLKRQRQKFDRPRQS